MPKKLGINRRSGHLFEFSGLLRFARNDGKALSLRAKRSNPEDLQTAVLWRAAQVIVFTLF